MPLDYRRDPRYAHLTAEQVRAHYEAERELRQHLLDSPPERRAEAFLWAYDELFRRCPWHPALTETSGPAARHLIQERSGSILRLLPCPPGASVLEIGCGMGELMLGLAAEGYRCVGIDISAIRIERLQAWQAPNLRFQQVDGTQLPFADSEFDAAISMQLFEHLHPDDALQHLEEVRRVLKPGGCYLVETPNKWVGPGDVSRFFCEQPQGFHLREYSISEMLSLLRKTGYEPIRVVLWRRNCLGAERAALYETCWRVLPKRIRRKSTLGLHNPIYLAHRPRR